MYLLLDLGNTNLYAGVYHNGSLVKEYRTYSDLNRSSDGYYDLFNLFFKQNNFDSKDFKGAILSSVVPSLTSEIVEAVERLINQKCLVVGPKVKSGLPIRIDNPNELGADLVADSVGALSKYGPGLVIVDLGTANKYLAVDHHGAFIGCVITPGIKLSMQALVKGAAQLMDISFIAPKKVIGKNSQDSLNSGSIYGTVAQIEGIVNKMEQEMEKPVIKILTGGNAILIQEHLKNRGYIYEKSLILEGLYQIYLRNEGKDYE